MASLISKILYYFSVSYTARINGTKTETGTAGVESKVTDFLQKIVKDKIRDHYKQSDSLVRTVGVVISGHEKFEQAEYENSKQGFTFLIGK